jgi:hypothetical protein
MAHHTDPEVSLMLLDPRILHGWLTVKYAVAFFKMSRSSFKRLFSCRALPEKYLTD